MECRLLLHGYRNAFENMAIDEALLINGITTLRFYKWKPSAISIGYFQSIEEEVNIEECKEIGIDIVRRITGGGAVYHDMNGEITYSIVMPNVFSNVMESYKIISKCLINGLKRIGINARHSGINDIVVNGRKISGNAQTRRHGIILQHGTVLLKTDIKKMFSLLNVSDKKISDKEIGKIEERVTSIEKEIGKINENELIKALIKGFEETLNFKFFEGSLEENEIELARKLVDKYESKEWNYKR